MSVAVLEHLFEVATGVDVEHREGQGCRPERLMGQVQHDDGVLAPREEEHGALELGRHLAEDVDGLGLERAQVRQAVMAGARPHAVASTLVSNQVLSPQRALLRVPGRVPGSGLSLGETLKFASGPPAGGDRRSMHRPSSGWVCALARASGTRRGGAGRTRRPEVRVRGTRRREPGSASPRSIRRRRRPRWHREEAPAHRGSGSRRRPRPSGPLPTSWRRWSCRRGPH